MYCFNETLIARFENLCIKCKSSSSLHCVALSHAAALRNVCGSSAIFSCQRSHPNKNNMSNQHVDSVDTMISPMRFPILGLITKTHKIELWSVLVAESLSYRLSASRCLIKFHKRDFLKFSMLSHFWRKQDKTKPDISSAAPTNSPTNLSITSEHCKFTVESNVMTNTVTYIFYNSKKPAANFYRSSMFNSLQATNKIRSIFAFCLSWQSIHTQ